MTAYLNLFHMIYHFWKCQNLNVQLQHIVCIKPRREREVKEKIQLGAMKNRNSLQLLDNNFVWITWIQHGDKNSTVIWKLIDEFANRIQKEDTLNNNVIQKPIDEFAKRICEGDWKNKNMIRKPIYEFGKIIHKGDSKNSYVIQQYIDEFVKRIQNRGM